MEGVEEVIVDVLDPFAQLIYNDQALKQAWTDPNRRSQMLYDYLIGFATGFGGGGVRTAAEAIGNKGSTAQTANSAADTSSAESPDPSKSRQEASGAQTASNGIETQESAANAGTVKVDENVLAAQMMFGDYSTKEIYQRTGVVLDAEGDPVVSPSQMLMDQIMDPDGEASEPLQWPGEDAIVEGDGGESNSPPSDVTLETNIIPNNFSVTGHIFRSKEGHIQDTAENRFLLESVANNENNFLGYDMYGNQWYALVQPDGRQVWVEARNGIIFDGGINNISLSWNPKTGLKKP